jgi:hypothetical protein
LPHKGLAVGTDWRLTSDPYNVILSRRVKTKSGREQWETFGYYSTVGNALIGLVRQGVRDTELASVHVVLDRIAELEAQILKMSAGQ